MGQLLLEKNQNQKPQPIKTLETAQKPYRNNIAAARNLFEKDNNETNEQKNKNVELIKEQNDNEDSEKIIQNGNKSENVTPPKPLPRRTNSLSESDDVPVQKPVARPRTNSVITTSAPLTVATDKPSTTNAPSTHSPNINIPTTYKVTRCRVPSWIRTVLVFLVDFSYFFILDCFCLSMFTPLFC